MVDHNIHFRNEFTEQFSHPDANGTFGVQKDLERFALRDAVERSFKVVGTGDPTSEDLDHYEEDLMITNPIVNTDDTIGGVDKSRKYKERRVVLNINSLQRSQFKEIPIEETDEYTDLGLSRDENGTYTREEIDDEENISIIEVTAEELNNEFEPGPTDVPRPYVPKNNGDIIKYEYNFRTPDYYEFMLPKIFNNVKSVRLLSSEVPNTINTVNSRNNLILLDIRDEDTGGSISLKPNSSPFSFFLLQIPTGNYTLNSIATILEDLINETVKLYSVDEYEDFDDWILSEIRERVELVQDFDKLCGTIVTEYINICKNYRITEEEILVPKMIKVLEPVL